MAAPGQVAFAFEVPPPAPDHGGAAPVLPGTAGWSLPRACWPHFPATGSQLERYAAVLPAVEVNTSFYRPHQPRTWARWAASTPPGFRFAAKLPRTLTHQQRLRQPEALLDAFLADVGALGAKLGCLLVQLPPSLALVPADARHFFAALRRRHGGALACEPRHASWFGPLAEDLWQQHCIARVAADPPPVAGAAEPGGWDGLEYWRWHGAPRIYWSDYAPVRLDWLAARLQAAQARGAQAWAILDNTAAGAATANALALQQRLAA